MTVHGMDDNSFTYGNVKSIRDTDKALLVEDDDGDQIWVPKSQLTEDSEVWKTGQDGDLVVTKWFAEQHGWM